MNNLCYYEKDGKRYTSKPRGLVLRKNGELDRRYAINRGWRIGDLTSDKLMPKIVDGIFLENTLIRRLLK